MKMDVNLLLALATAHLLADFVFQSDKDMAGKKRAGVQWKHTVIVAGLSFLLAGDWHAWRVVAVVGLAHFLIDRVKVGLNRNSLGVFLLDQAAHLLVIFGLTWLSPLVWPVQNYWMSLWGVAFAKALVIVAGLILTTNVGSVLVGILVQPYLDELTKRQSDKSVLTARKEEQRGLKKGGKTIGQLERILIFILVMIGKPESIAFLIAAKSVFRFGELKEYEHRAEAEYITIGTMMSFAWGLVSAWGTWRLIGYL